MQITDGPPTTAIQELSQDELLSTFTANIEKIYENNPRFTGEKAYVEKKAAQELAFYNAALERYEIWSEEEGAIVLWDIDNTIAVNSPAKTSTEPSTWNIRPAFPLLVAEIQRRYPKIKNGLLSSRTDIASFFTQLETDNIDTSFFAADQIHSSDAKYDQIERQDPEKANIFKERLTELGFSSLKIDDNRKWVVVQSLKETGLNVKLIDDMDVVATAMGPNGLSCRQMMAP